MIAEGKMFHRDAENKLAMWAQRDGRKPLLVRGARQVGKTVAIRRFAERFGCFIELNLERPEDREPFEHDLNARQIFEAIVLRRRARPIPGKSLLFLDEIQVCPDAVRMLRYFHEDLPDLHVVGAGSLLEIALAKADVEFPVGRVEHLAMYPVSFPEYLDAFIPA